MNPRLQAIMKPQCWPAAWCSYWFAESSPVRLAVLRILIVGLQLTWFRHLLHVHHKRITDNPGFIEPQLLVKLISSAVGQELFRNTVTFTTLYVLWLATGVLAVIGLFARPAMIVFALLNLVFISHKYSYGEHHHAQAIYTLFILFMALAPCNRALSIDAWLARRKTRNTPAAALQPTGHDMTRRDVLWPILLTQWLLCLAYLNAGAAKLAVGGLDWFNGVTLQTYLLQDGIRWDRPLGLWVARQYWLCLILSLGAIAFELFFPLILVFRRLAPLLLVGGVMLHMGVFILQAAPFWQFMVLYLLWVPWERLPGLRAGAKA